MKKYVAIITLCLSTMLMGVTSYTFASTNVHHPTNQEVEKKHVSSDQSSILKTVNHVYPVLFSLTNHSNTGAIADRLYQQGWITGLYRQDEQDTGWSVFVSRYHVDRLWSSNFKIESIGTQNMGGIDMATVKISRILNFHTTKGNTVSARQEFVYVLWKENGIWKINSSKVLSSEAIQPTSTKKQITTTNAKVITFGQLVQETNQLANKIFMSQSSPSKSQIAEFKSFIPYWMQARVDNVDNTGLVQQISDVLTILNFPTKSNIASLLNETELIESTQGFDPSQKITLSSGKSQPAHTKTITFGELVQETNQLANHIFESNSSPTDSQIAEFKSFIPYWKQARVDNVDNTDLVQQISDILTQLNFPTNSNVDQLVNSTELIESTQGFNSSQKITITLS